MHAGVTDHIATNYLIVIQPMDSENLAGYLFSVFGPVSAPIRRRSKYLVCAEIG